MSDNGKLPASELTEVPGGRLAKEAAANWLAMRAKGGKELGIWISPLGPRSSYRTFVEQQYFWNLYKAGKGNLAATPGTSNHGKGEAVDLASWPTARKVVDRYGASYGWHWGEVSSEGWHVTYRGGGKARAEDVVTDERPSLKSGDRADAVKRVQTWLSAHGFDIPADGSYGPKTADAVSRVYRAWGHAPHERFGDVGWSIIEDKHPWRVLENDERRMLADLYAVRRDIKRDGGWDAAGPKQKAQAKECREWLVARRKEIWRTGKAKGWNKRRRRRYQMIKRATT